MSELLVALVGQAGDAAQARTGRTLVARMKALPRLPVGNVTPAVTLSGLNITGTGRLVGVGIFNSSSPIVDATVTIDGGSPQTIRLVGSSSNNGFRNSSMGGNGWIPLNLRFNSSLVVSYAFESGSASLRTWYTLE